MHKTIIALIIFDLGEDYVATLSARFPQIEFRYAPAARRDEVMAQLDQVQILIGHQVPECPADFPNLDWIQLTGAGYDYLQSEQLNSRVTITNAPLFGIPIAEYVLWSMLALSRHLSNYASDFHARREWPTNHWQSHVGDELFGKTLGIVGFGTIGQTIAKLGVAFGMQVMATRRSATTPIIVDGVRVLPSEQLQVLLAASDFVVLSLPLTAANLHLIGVQQFEQMKTGAYLINIARGTIVDQQALIAALQSGKLRGAALDVFEQEPLSADNPLFELPNVFLTPHIAGVTSAYYARTTDYFAENLQRYLDGRPLLNVISCSKSAAHTL
jgi:phosphoglycerate dehydrogenase-like enzyme